MLEADCSTGLRAAVQRGDSGILSRCKVDECQGASDNATAFLFLRSQ